eukprot:GEMP01054552.1.p1 GENE.GEMP01054552.1~~GEMP01054552.1.p1  ORF type:complete len:323 (+),score=59.66 GEMP01054552.1:156-1124(+)
MDRMPSFTHHSSPTFPPSRPSPPASPTFGRKIRHAPKNSRRTHSPFNSRHTTDHAWTKSASPTRMFTAHNPRALSSTASPSRAAAPDDVTSPHPAVGVDRNDASISASQQGSWTFRDDANDAPLAQDRTANSSFNRSIFRGSTWQDSADGVVVPSLTQPSPVIAGGRSDTAADNTTSASEYGGRKMPSATSTLEYTGPPFPVAGNHASGGSSMRTSYGECNRGLLESIDAVLGMGNCNPLLIAVSGHVKTALRRALMDLRAHTMGSRADQLREHVKGLIKPLLLQKAKLFALAVQLVLRSLSVITRSFRRLSPRNTSEHGPR